MVTSLKMERQVSRQCSLVQGNEDASLALGPEKNVGIGSSQGKVHRIADAQNVEWIRAESVVLLNGLPEPSAPEVLVQQIAQRHASHRLRAILVFYPP